MQEIKKKSKRNFLINKYKESSKEILLSLFLAGALTIASTSPYFWLNLAKLIIKKRKYLKRKIDEKKLAKLLSRLKENRLIILSEKNGEFKVELTEKGKRIVKEIQFENMKIEKPASWDKKWRIVAFDIPDKHKKRARDVLREKLKEMKFYQFQKSVFVYPYPCEKEIQFLCELFDITHFVNIITAEKIYNDIKLKKYFGLV